MDMSVKLNLSYPTVKPVEATTERPAAKPVAAVEAITPAKDTATRGCPKQRR